MGARPSGAGGTDFDAVLGSVAQPVMTEIARSSREQGGPSIGHGCTFEKFTKMNPSTFLGGVNPAAAENWMQEIEKFVAKINQNDVASFNSAERASGCLGPPPPRTVLLLSNPSRSFHTPADGMASFLFLTRPGVISLRQHRSRRLFRNGGYGCSHHKESAIRNI
ncbi:uncharacterized protein LOC131167486 [Malania oleifera]|uniref:uncharacterized protein LOC131167486 n=1 Tax=Malania oleifera TaxID=397392 RepID=UPI0025AE93D2|nr:uncharacterized protein LOC131167486 [Malania oleifera]